MFFLDQKYIDVDAYITLTFHFYLKYPRLGTVTTLHGQFQFYMSFLVCNQHILVLNHVLVDF